ncbi:exopolysaccharide production repressor protein [Mesorhizobium sp. 113-1-2]|uniref:exopolysaccharide production repressor protein n=1 Tax=Mesorhizobium sp. 113-1-2 TaxID=2744515 RepID=UPI00237C1B24|nr:exopolysaccharide production repressor protein [Mesorhizobium sp. 113-1-2]
MIVYVASYSIGRAIVITLASSLLLQLAYFASVLFLVWQSGCARKAGKSADASLWFPRRWSPHRSMPTCGSLRLNRKESAGNPQGSDGRSESAADQSKQRLWNEFCVAISAE